MTFPKLITYKTFKRRSAKGKLRAYQDAKLTIKKLRRQLSNQREWKAQIELQELFSKEEKERLLVSGFLKHAPLYWQVKLENEQLREKLAALSEAR